MSASVDPKQQRSPDDHRETWGLVLPFGVFMGFLLVLGLLSRLAVDLSPGVPPFWLAHPEYWIYPLQTVVCGILLLRYRDVYRFNGMRRPVLALATGVLVLAIWVLPQWIPGADQRPFGFDPTLFEDNPTLFWFTVGMRFLRLVVIVPFLEEIFWRGFLMRYLVSQDYRTVSFGKFTPFSFFGVAILFGLAHFGPDFWVAIITGILYNALACVTRSLGACVLAHALTNLLLGIYIMQTGKWGFW